MATFQPMNKPFTLIFFLSFPIYFIGQNAFFVPFGQTPDEVQAFLGEKDYLTSVYTSLRRDSVVAVGKMNDEVVYLFDNDELYRVFNSKKFTNLKEAERVEAAILEYFKVRKGKITSTTNYGTTKHFCILDDRLIFVEVDGDKKLGYKTISIVALSRNHGPRMQTEDYITRVSKY